MKIVSFGNNSMIEELFWYSKWSFKMTSESDRKKSFGKRERGKKGVRSEKQGHFLKMRFCHTHTNLEIGGSESLSAFFVDGNGSARGIFFEPFLPSGKKPAVASRKASVHTKEWQIKYKFSKFWFRNLFQKIVEYIFLNFFLRNLLRHFWLGGPAGQ